MTGITPLLILLGAGSVALTAYLYLTRELEVGGRGLLLLSRVAAIVILIGLVSDLTVPGSGSPSLGEGEPWVLVDDELSLVSPVGSGRTVRDQVVERSAALTRAGARLALAGLTGDGPEGVDQEGLQAREPGYPPGDPIDGVLRLSEAGATEVTILSSFRWSPGMMETLISRTPVPLRLEGVGGPTRNAGIAELSLPEDLPRGAEVDARLTVFTEAVEPTDSIRLEIRADGELVGEAHVLAAGAAAREVTLPVMTPAGEGTVRYTARVFLEGDLFTADDQRVRWIETDGERSGIVLVSFRPDWEPRTLLPVLEAVTGIPGEGYLRLADGRFLPLVAGSDGTVPTSEEEVARRASSAELLVLHSPGADLPDWVVAVGRSHPRLLQLSAAQGDPSWPGLQLEPPIEGEWAVAAELPSTAVAPFMTGIPLGGLPPLSALTPPAGPTAGIVALNAAPLRGGESRPALLLLDSDAGRRAVTLAEGFWRWGVREGEARRAYRALWAGVSGWLMSGGRGNAAVRPERLVQARGDPLRWEGGLSTTDLELTLEQIHDGWDGPLGPVDSDGVEPIYQARLVSGEEGVGLTPPADPGIYRFTVRDTLTDPDSVVASGLVEVERWAHSLQRPPLDPAPSVAASATAPGRDTGSGDRPLRGHPLPYVLLLLLLCGEWLGRRRLGLR